jgi:Xaa-Pro aminopeptidase
MTRTVAVGQVSEEMEQVYCIVQRAQQAGLDAARAGKTGAEVDAAARDIIREAGYGAYFGHALGHSLGLEVHESPNATPNNDKPLPEGAVISIEPGIYLPGRFGVRIEDTVLLKCGGCENLMTFSKDLLHL